MNYFFTIPVIVMTTLTGTANFATNSIVSDEKDQKYVTFGIGAVSLIAGIISTVANFLRYAQNSEAHRVAAISWGKFQRFISIELSLHPNERMDAMSFLKMGRIELDRLIEQSPPIPSKSVELFLVAFQNKKDIIRPEIAGGIEHTRVFDDRDSRLAKIAVEAVYTLQQKKKLMKDLVMEEIDEHIATKTKEERIAMEAELREEIMEVAKNAAADALKANVAAVRATPPVVPSIPLPTTGFQLQKQDLKNVIAPGIIEKAKESLTAGKGPGPGSAPMRSPSDLAFRVANMAASVANQRIAVGSGATPPSGAGTAATSTPPIDSGPSSIRLQIIDEDDEFQQVDSPVGSPTPHYIPFK